MAIDGLYACNAGAGAGDVGAALVHLSELRIGNLRVIREQAIRLGRGWNVFVGANGAGKTSILEAAFLLSHGRSFRRGTRDTLSRLGSDGYSVFGRLQLANGWERRLGIARVGGKLEARVDGEVVGISGLVQTCAVACFEPGSHELIGGIAEERRRYLDWGVFHVEHGFLQDWRRYQRALRQRNSVLRNGGGDADLEPWEIEMASAGERIGQFRLAYLDRLRPILQSVLEGFLGELGEATITLERGWKAEQTLAGALVDARQRDRERGHTGKGPHRADWTLAFEHAPRREHLSRGQEKLCALALVLAQARLFALQTGEWPILCFDDLASELDQAHQGQVIEQLWASGAQVLITGTERPPALDADHGPVRLFHVEQGRIDA
ncbi:MAG: DNA replication/repair protein RecF [Xanthomonadales bacterium]|nr:DNA replication/repair protein RecF [Xanthomonadales bacterium]MBL0223746.1 DNA replication/repair protein RecF [Xanthomonadales bacterium]